MTGIGFLATEERVFGVAAAFFAIVGVLLLVTRHRGTLLAALTSDEQKKLFLWECFGTLAGAALGGYLSAVEKNYAYVAVGIVFGAVSGTVIGLFGRRVVSLPTLEKSLRYVRLGLATLSFLLAVAGIVGFFRKGDWMIAVAAVFFVVCGLAILATSRSRTDSRHPLV